jgi:hypothetical protein
MRSVTTLAALALWLFAAPASAVAQSSEEIQLRARPAAAPSGPDEQKNVVLSLDAEYVKGDKAARLALVEFTDYQ